LSPYLSGGKKEKGEREESVFIVCSRILSAGKKKKDRFTKGARERVRARRFDIQGERGKRRGEKEKTVPSFCKLA